MSGIPIAFTGVIDRSPDGTETHYTSEQWAFKQKLDLIEGGLRLLLEAVKADDPKDEIIFRIEDELRQLRR